MTTSKSQPTKLAINGRRFEYVSTRTYDPTEVYRGGNSYMRIGPANIIDKEVALQRKLLGSGFPVAEITKFGIAGKRHFYIEKALGKRILRHAFAQDYRRYGRVTSKSFSLYLKLTKKFAVAQLSTIGESRRNEFYKAVHIADLMSEFPEMAKPVSRAFKMAKDRISAFPVVLCHGDLNVSNFLSRGIIDFEWVFWGYAGYDVVGNLFFTYFFPKTKIERSIRMYEPTEGQVAEYMDAIDAIYVEHGLPRPSDYKDDLIYPKAVWAASKMGAYPRMQKWRFDVLKRITEEYLDGRPIIGTIRKFPS